MILLNGQEIKFTTFPNGETKVDERSIIKAANLGGENQNKISFKYESDADLIKLFLVKAHMNERMGIGKVDLLIYYMPYSRMDRTEGLSVFTLKYIADYINHLGFFSITVLEPHSDVTPALLQRVIAKYPTTKLLRIAKGDIGFDKEKDIIFFPDAGAQKRYHHLAEGNKSLVGYKHRNFETGKIESFQVVGEVPSNPFRAVIVDDLSSYGGTFIAAANELQKIGATEIYLVIAHAENSILEGQIFKTDLIDKVYTTNSIIDLDNHSERLAIFDVELL